MFDLKIHKEIIINLCQCILQSRINVEKQQIQFFNDFIMHFQKYKERAFKGSLEVLLTNLIKQQKTEARQKIMKNMKQDKAVIALMLESLQGQVCVQQWILLLHPKVELAEHSDDTFFLVASMFEELLFFLSNQPLFSQYIKDAKMKQLYKIHYNFYICSNNELQDEQQQLLNISHFPKVYYKQRACQQFIVTLSCYTLKSLYDLKWIKQKKLIPKQKFKKFRLKNFLNPRHSNEEKIKNKQDQSQEFINLQVIKERKHSLYEIYDPQLECTLLSSSQNTFISTPRGSIKQIKFFPKELGLDDEFQILKLSLDQQFLQQNMKLFKQLSQIQKKLKFI